MKSRIAANFSAAMDASGITAAELARRLGLNEKTVRRWRAGDVMPDSEKLAEAAEEIGVDLTSLYMPPAEPVDPKTEAAA